MTKQEGIREELERRYYYAAHPLGNWNDTTFKNKVVARNNTNEILTYLHSQGVVIKVDRELPQYGRELFHIGHELAGSNLCPKCHYLLAQDQLIEGGYVAVEPLI